MSFPIKPPNFGPMGPARPMPSMAPRPLPSLPRFEPPLPPPSQLHQSPNWEKAHVDRGRMHGLSPTLNPPRTLDGVKEIADWKDLPAPFGPTIGYPNDIRKK